VKTIAWISRKRALSLIRWARKLKDTALLTRVLVVVEVLLRGRDHRSVADSLGCVPASVSRWVNRFRAGKREGLLDRRADNGTTKATDTFVQVVDEVLWGSPLDHGYTRPTWTRELLALVVETQTGVRVSVGVMGRVLSRLGARRGNPKPVVECPLSNRQQRRRLAKIRQLIAELPVDEVAVFEDEVDIHLNPKIGLDWMHHGHQRLVVTPGKNQKAYVAGSLDARDGTIVWVGATQKNTNLFVQFLEKLTQHYADAKRIHVILDNYGIHKSGEARRALRGLGRIRLHFLPPYSPDHNRIERLWQDLHANVTRNHRHQTLESLCEAVSQYLNAASPWLPDSRPQSRSRKRGRFTPRRRTATYRHRPGIQAHSRSAAPESRSVI
jgi:transposase